MPIYDYDTDRRRSPRRIADQKIRAQMIFLLWMVALTCLAMGYYIGAAEADQRMHAVTAEVSR